MYNGGAGLEPWVEVRSSGVEGAGKGLFALREFSAGETVAVYMGRVVRGEERRGYMERAHAAAQEYEASGGTRGVQAADGYVMKCGSVWVDGVADSNIARYINDSRGSRWVDNARVKQGGQYGKANEGDERWGAAVVTTRRVREGEEFFFSYGPEYWEWQEAQRRDKQRLRGGDDRCGKDGGIDDGGHSDGGDGGDSNTSGGSGGVAERGDNGSSGGRDHSDHSGGGGGGNGKQAAKDTGNGCEGCGSDDNGDGSSGQASNASHTGSDNAYNRKDKDRICGSTGGRTEDNESGAGGARTGRCAGEMSQANHSSRTQPQSRRDAHQADAQAAGTSTSNGAATTGSSTVASPSTASNQEPELQRSQPDVQNACGKRIQMTKAQNACNPGKKQTTFGESKVEKSLGGRDWGEVRRARARKASAAHGEAVKEAREVRRAARRGEAVHEGGDSSSCSSRHRRALGGGAVEGEHSGKRRRVERQAGRDGTGAVPTAVT